MTYVVTSECQTCKATDCVQVCPVDCFYEIDKQLIIHPDDCIDCGACEPECPNTAIFEESEVPEQFAGSIVENAKHFDSWEVEKQGLEIPRPINEKRPGIGVCDMI